jgi:hypothetical protein
MSKKIMAKDVFMWSGGHLGPDGTAAQHVANEANAFYAEEIQQLRDENERLVNSLLIERQAQARDLLIIENALADIRQIKSLKWPV